MAGFDESEPHGACALGGYEYAACFEFRIRRHAVLDCVAHCVHRCELPGNYPVFTVLMVIYTFVRRISIITLPPDFF